MFGIDDAIAGIGSAIGGITSAIGQERANKANERMARENREWQERMANTAHQREVKDLYAAGLNPILSVSGGKGSATPAGAQATANPVDFGSGLSSAVSHAMAYKQMMNTQKLQEAQIAATAAQANLNMSNSAVAAQRVKTEQALAANYNANSARAVAETDATRSGRYLQGFGQFGRDINSAYSWLKDSVDGATTKGINRLTDIAGHSKPMDWSNVNRLYHSFTRYIGGR